MTNNLLTGQKGIIFGALDEKSIAWRTAIRAYEEGAQLVLTNAPIARRMGKITELSKLLDNGDKISNYNLYNTKMRLMFKIIAEFISHKIKTFRIICNFYEDITFSD